MNLTSIRWRLPLSYAAIALLAAIALGSVMLLVLGEYYARQEREYLLGNAQSLQPIVEGLLKAEAQPGTLQNLLEGFSFFSQTRLRILDDSGKTLSDSGIPDPNQQVSLSSGWTDQVMFSVPIEPGTQYGMAFPDPAGTVFSSNSQTGEGTVIGGPNYIFSIHPSPLGYALTTFPASPATSIDLSRRSRQAISLPLNGSLGNLEISAGPAYGRDIIRSVSLAWAGAGVVAVLLAGLGGWFASRRFTQPVLALTGATRRMEAGDLSTRVILPGRNQTTEFQALAHSFNAMAGQVETTVSTLRAFVADAAHELHTPLTALHTNLELAADETRAAQRGIYLERAQEQDARLERLVTGLLNLSHLEAIQPGKEAIRLVLNHLLGELEEQFASRAEQAGRVLNVSIPEELLSINGNPLQVHQAITNLFENALKFTPAGGAITIALTQVEANAVLTVADSGIGVPPEDLPNLFERFHRGRNASAYPGSGLGLAITRAIVHTHGGSIQAESNPGEGMKVTIKFPLV